MKYNLYEKNFLAIKLNWLFYKNTNNLYPTKQKLKA